MPEALLLATLRLNLRPFGEDDFEAFYTACVCDPAVMAFYHAYRGIPSDAERRTRARRDFLEHFADGRRARGYICWALRPGPALPAPPDTFVGWCGIVTSALEESRWGPELAYMLARPWHGAGLATEAAAAVMADAWRRYGLSRLHAVVDTPNTASRRVLDRVGLALHGAVEVYGSTDMLLYTAAAPRPAA
jgi:[ribosomal protein S5]-alanine N-acetyltransferase